jgi:hypothetical protein
MPCKYTDLGKNTKTADELTSIFKHQFAWVTGDCNDNTCYECTTSSDKLKLCKKVDTCPEDPPTPDPTDPTPDPTDPTPDPTDKTGGGITINPAAETALERMYHKLNLHVNAKDPALDKEFKDLRKELRGRVEVKMECTCQKC